MQNYHHLSEKEIFNQLKTSTQGLCPQEAAKRLEQYGENKLKLEKRVHPLKIIFAQFSSPLIWILILALAISIFLKDITNVIVLSFIVLVNVILGFFQEYKAERAIEALQKMTALKCKVLREGKRYIIDSKDLVPGDIILIEEGDNIPADARLIEACQLETQEGSFTGESLPVHKNIEVLPEKIVLADRRNMVYASTSVEQGRGKAIVVNVGMNTEVGKIASLMQDEPENLTPLQYRLKNLSKYLTIGVIILAIIIFFFGIMEGKEITAMFLTAMALAVAVIPEGLPTVITISLALGVQRMLKKNALIRKLPSVETLGSVNVICTDKTGTLTHNQMTVTKIWANNEKYDVTGSGYEIEGEFLRQNKATDISHLKTLLKIGVLCNNAQLEIKDKKVTIMGDPTEAALLVAAEKAGMNYLEFQKKEKRIEEITFTSSRKMMSTINLNGKDKCAYIKGAPDIMLAKCNRILIQGKVIALNEKKKKEILSIMHSWAKEALRVLAFAYNDSFSRKEETEKNMVFVGLQGMIDPPREEVKESIKKCQEAGIKVVMITGDHLLTAKAIAERLGIIGRAVTVEEFSEINLGAQIDKISVFARVEPEHKLRIIEALKKKDYVVAMTGDGVNDAPALKKADIGIAMGISGTDVAKEASQMILVDDNFTSIVNAVEEGRNIYDNIKVFLNYLFSGNLGELFFILSAILIGLPLPLLALQILWINLVTETIPATTIALEKPKIEVMKELPRKFKDKIFEKRDIFWVLSVSILIAGLSLGLFYYNLGMKFSSQYQPWIYSHAITLAFTTFVLFQIFNIFNNRSKTRSVFSKDLFSNWWLWLAVIIVLGLQALAVYLPFLNRVLGTIPLNEQDWLIATLVSSSILWYGEVVKWVRRKRKEVIKK